MILYVYKSYKKNFSVRVTIYKYQPYKPRFIKVIKVKEYELVNNVDMPVSLIDYLLTQQIAA
jgi:hypothetical protein